MLVKTYRADDKIEIFSTNEYTLSKPKDFHPLLLSVKVYTDNGKLLYKISRRFKWYYKHFTFKTAEVQNKLKSLTEK